jgi:hypothetical protein
MSAGRPELNADIALGELVFNTVDDDGTLWVVSDLEGWWTLPEPDIGDYPFPIGDGSYETSGRYQARLINLNGTFFPATPDQLKVARQKLINQANLCRQSTWLTAVESDYTKGSSVIMSGQPLIQTVKPSGQTNFSIGLKAGDPVKYALEDGEPPGWYSVTHTSNGAFSATNEGDYPVDTRITVEGPTSDPWFILNDDTLEKMEMAQFLSGAQTLIADSRDRTVTVNGNRNKRFFLTWDTDWLRLAPGVNNFSVVGAGAFEITMQWRHGWIG